MYISKHHYAIELAKRGNTVYFLNPPGENHNAPVAVNILPLPDAPNLWLITHRHYFPIKIRFHWRRLFHALMKVQIKRILKKLGEPVEIIWSFDLNNLYEWKSFPPNVFKIFNPVDEPLHQDALQAGKDCDIILSVTEDIVSRFSDCNVPAYMINHGVADYFIEAGTKPVNRSEKNVIRVGISGNFLRPDIDWPILLDIIDAHPNIQFECWGVYLSKSSNIGELDSRSTEKYLCDFINKENVILHGPVPSRELAASLPFMDAFLICYDVKKDQSQGSNYHKVMEYLATGKVIISNNISTYHNRADLVQMVEERDHNYSLPILFDRIISNLEYYNSADKSHIRKLFAAENSYSKKINLIETLLASQ